MLNHDDPLYEVLALRVYPEIKRPVFRVERLSRSRLVYRYREAETRRAVVGKFFDIQDQDERRVARIKSEYRKLIRLRYLGFNMYPHYVVNPLCREERIGLAVAEEFVAGDDLDHYLKDAAWHGGGASLREVLDHLADFLHRLHSRSAADPHTPGCPSARVDEVAAYFAQIVATLQRQGLLASDQAVAYLRLLDRWLGRPCMRAETVTVHGDATPTNFLFPSRQDVVAIDLERMKEADRVFDLGMVCGEIKHAFFWRTGRLDGSEPFIRHFLERYVCHCPAPDGTFREITRRVPFYMGLTELRIARNTWLDWRYRRRLVQEARECLTSGLRL
jgi:aminoglycoside phosphotransferase (APT) family kinase protein